MELAIQYHLINDDIIIKIRKSLGNYLTLFVTTIKWHVIARYYNKYSDPKIILNSEHMKDP